MALIQLLNVEGDESEENGQITETWYCEYSDIQNGYTLSYPAIGSAWNNNNNFICTTIRYNRENQRYYGKDYLGNNKNGADLVTLQATYKRNYSVVEDVFSMKIASSGTKNFKITSSGNWGVIQKPCGYEAGQFEIKEPILQYDFTTNFIGQELNAKWYADQVGKINNGEVTQMGLTADDKGRALFESFSIVPNYSMVNGVRTLIDTTLTLTFKLGVRDWNWEWRNPVQAVNQYDNKPMVWQNKYSNRPDYTNVASKVNMPIWSGEVNGYGDPAYGTAGWDYRTWTFTSGDTTITYYPYGYADLGALFNGEPTPSAEENSNV